jgi:thiamine biosynthesis lipoprotein
MPQQVRSDDPHAVTLAYEQDHWVGRFVAMACPCEVLIDAHSADLARTLVTSVAGVAWRIERKFSRYRSDSVVQEINSTAGRAFAVDDETAHLLDFATTLTELSDGHFDITSGVLRRVWTFDGGNTVPSQDQIGALMPLVGWNKVVWRRPYLTLLPGMQIDFGGIGKEYAVDSAALLVGSLAPDVSCLVNFGGDIAVRAPRDSDREWSVGVERCDQSGVARELVKLRRGALATSGDSRRFVLKEGRRYSHILDARTGWPIPDAPRSITVAADTCTQAGTLTTLAMLQGKGASDFLRTTNCKYWLQ